jgi:hypothetical protein
MEIHTYTGIFCNVLNIQHSLEFLLGLIQSFSMVDMASTVLGVQIVHYLLVSRTILIKIIKPWL